MTVSPTATTTELGPDTGRLLAKVGRAIVSLVAFALLAGVWLAYFIVVPLDFTVR